MLTIQQALSHPTVDRQTLLFALAHLLGQNLAFLRLYDEEILTKTQAALWKKWVVRLEAGEPLAYIIGKQDFWSMTFKVTADTLIPRPDTECLVEAARQSFTNDLPISVLDLGTGSGVIAIALASERPKWSFIATDINEAAIEVAKKNAESLRRSGITFYQGSWFDALPETQERFDLIVSNPPYIDSEDEHLEDLHFEPLSALVAGEHGMKDLQEIIIKGFNWLNNNGWLMVEHGWDQGDLCRQLFDECGYEQVKTLRDFGGRERITIGLRPYGIDDFIPNIPAAVVLDDDEQPND